MSAQHTHSDTAGIERAKPAAAPAEFDPLSALKDALEDLIQFTAEDALSCWTNITGDTGPRDPDHAGAERAYEGVMIEVRKLLAPKQMPAATSEAKPHPAPGILTTHDPSASVAKADWGNS